MSQSFDKFLKLRRAAATDYTNGKADAVVTLSADSGPASFFGPDGSVVEGAAAVRKSYSDGASYFNEGGATELDIRDQGASGDIGFWSGFQRARVLLKDKDKPVDMVLRITEIFRRQDGEWRMVHRHASMAKPGA